MQQGAGDPDELSALVRSSLAILAEYRQGSVKAFLADAERREQRLPGGLTLQDREIVESLLLQSEAGEEASMVAAIHAVGSKRASDLLKKALARPRRPCPQLSLEPYLERHSVGTTWLLERVEVGVTGLNVVTRLYTQWPSDAQLEPGPQQIRPHLRWKGYRSIRDDTGRAMRFVAGGTRPTVARVTAGDGVGQRYAVVEDYWWGPGVAWNARSISITTDIAIEVDCWTGDPALPWLPETLDLGHFTCTLAFPERWSGGLFTPLDDPGSVRKS